MDERDPAVECGNRGRISCRRIALCENTVRLNLADKMIQPSNELARQQRRGMAAPLVPYRHIGLEAEFRERIFQQVTLLAGGHNPHDCPIGILQPANNRRNLDHFRSRADNEGKSSDGS